MKEDVQIIRLEGIESLLTKHELALMFRVCHRTIERLVARGQLPPPIRLGRSCRWRNEDIRQFMRRGTVARG